MSEEVAASIGDVLAENARLREQVRQSMELLSATPETMAGQTLPEAVATVLRAMRAAQQLHLQALGLAQQYKRDLEAELQGSGELRALLGALERETMWGMAERIVSERETTRQQLAQAEERARIASEAYHQQQDAQREHEARYQAAVERAQVAEEHAARYWAALRRFASASTAWQRPTAPEEQVVESGN